MNVSLTAIALIWNVADQLAKLTAHGGVSDSQSPGEKPAAQQDAAAPEALSAAHLEALLRQLFSALQVPPAASLCSTGAQRCTLCRAAPWCVFLGGTRPGRA